MKNLLPALILAIAINPIFAGLAQQPDTPPPASLQIKKAALWLGGRSIQLNASKGSQLDFLDYTDNLRLTEFIILGFSLQLQYHEIFQLSIDAFTADDIVPNSLKLQLLAQPRGSWIGLNAGFMRYPFLITGFEGFHLDQDPDFFADANTRQRRMHDLCLFAGPGISLQGKSTFLSVNFNVAYATLLPFSESFRQKQANSNLRREIIYKTQTSSSFLFFPELTFGADIASFTGKKIGLQIQASMLRGNRHIHYDKTVRQWSEENQSSEKVRSQGHRFEKTDITMGIYYRF